MEWPTYVGTVVRVVETAEGRKKHRTIRVEESTRKWHASGATPEQFFPTRLPQISLNTFMRRFVFDSDTSFVPTLFVLYPNALLATHKRDSYARCTWPLWITVTTPLSQDPLELERCEREEVCRVNGNRLLAGMEAMLMGDLFAALAHFLDAYFHLTHVGAETDAKRHATHKGNNALLEERASIQAGGASSSSTDVLLSLAKRNQAQSTFFRSAGSTTQPQPTPAPSFPSTYFTYIPTPTTSIVPSPSFTYTPTQFPSTSFQAPAVFLVPGGIPVQQNGRSAKRFRKRNQAAAQQPVTPVQTFWPNNPQPLQYNNAFQFPNQGLGRGFPNQRTQRGFFNQTRGRGRGANSAATVGAGILPAPAIASLPPVPPP